MALVKSFEFAGKPDLALIYLRQLLEQQSATQKQNVLQHVKLDLEKLHPAIEDETNAIRRLTTRQEVLEGRIAKQELFKAQVESMERMAVVAAAITTRLVEVPPQSVHTWNLPLNTPSS